MDKFKAALPELAMRTKEFATDIYLEGAPNQRQQEI